MELQDRCLECKRPMTQAGHYTAYLCCTKCRYSTCCSRAINIHGLLFHDRVSGLYWHWTQGGIAHWTVNKTGIQSFKISLSYYWLKLKVFGYFYLNLIVWLFLDIGEDQKYW